MASGASASDDLILPSCETLKLRRRVRLETLCHLQQLIEVKVVVPPHWAVSCRPQFWRFHTWKEIFFTVSS